MLSWVAKRLRDAGSMIRQTVAVDVAKLQEALPGHELTAQTLTRDLMRVSLALDLSHRPRYEQILSYLREMPTDNAALEEIFLRQAIAHLTDDALDFRRQLAILCAEHGRMQAARDSYEAALRRAPHDAETLNVAAAIALRSFTVRTRANHAAPVDQDFFTSIAARRPRIQGALNCAALLAILQRGLLTGEEVVALLDKLPVVGKLRAAGLLVAHAAPDVVVPIQNMLNKVGCTLRKIDSEQALAILRPLGGVMAVPFATPRPAAGLKTIWDKLLRCLAPTDVTEGLMYVVAAGGAADFKNIVRRLFTHRPNKALASLTCLQRISACIARPNARTQSKLIDYLADAPSEGHFDRYAGQVRSLAQVSPPKIRTLLLEAINEAGHVLELEYTDDVYGDADLAQLLGCLESVTYEQVVHMYQNKPAILQKVCMMFEAFLDDADLESHRPHHLDEFLRTLRNTLLLHNMFLLARGYHAANPGTSMSQDLRALLHAAGAQPLQAQKGRL